MPGVVKPVSLQPVIPVKKAESTATKPSELEDISDSDSTDSEHDPTYPVKGN